MIESLYGNFKDVLVMTWPMVFVSMVVLISLRLTYLFKSKKEIIIYNEIILFFFAFYVLCLFQIVTSTDDSLVGSSNFIPFKEIFRYEFGTPKFIRNVLGNIMLFIPFGFLSSYLLKNRKLGIVTILTLIASLTIETVQYYIGRVFDIDDIILNLLGGILGFLIYIGIDAIRNKVKILKNDTVLDILIIIILVLVIVYSFNINIFEVIGG